MNSNEFVTLLKLLEFKVCSTGTFKTQLVCSFLQISTQKSLSFNQVFKKKKCEQAGESDRLAVFAIYMLCGVEVTIIHTKVN